MYARYIPPPKGSKPPAPRIEADAPAPAPATATASPAFSTAPYARYVPPPRLSRPVLNPTATPTPAPRAPPPSKTHLNAAAIPPPESLRPKIVFDYDDEPSPSKKRKLDSPESAPEPSYETKEKKSKEAGSGDLKEERKGKEKKEKKEKKRKGRKTDAAPPDQSEGEDTKPEKKKRNKGKADKEPFAFGFDEEAIATDVAGAGLEEPADNRQQHEKLADNVKETKTKTKDPEVKTSKKRKDKGDISAHHKAVLEKAAKSMQESQRIQADRTTEPRDEDEDEAEPVEAHGLEPLPQPEPVVQDHSTPAYETLPGWIANPIRVTPTTNVSFTELGINTEAATKLEFKGYKNAFAVQTAVIPLLLPSPNRQGDVVVSAATGSGKTLSYVLPMVRDISQGVITGLRGLVIVPTRELVLQAKEVCETCASAFAGPGKKTVRVGISMGNKQFEHEQADVIEEGQRFDPAGHKKWLQTHFDRDFDVSHLDDVRRPLPDHVMDYTSKVDILICTPGRLVDHINRTPGFTLDSVRWLVVDEADKLLAQTFQDWLSVVMPRLSCTTAHPGARDFPDSNSSGVRKVVLSATMTRDLSLLNGLRLSRPNLVVLEGSKEESNDQSRENKTEHGLPELLEEFAVKIRDPNLKPLYLIDLLESAHMAPTNGADDDTEMKDAQDDGTSSSGSGSEVASADSDSSSDESDSDSDISAASSTHSPSHEATSAPATTFRTTVLIFTKSNETAVRLSRLLALLSPSVSPLIGTLTSTMRTSERRKTLRSFAARKLRILVASDLVARGIDLADLDHVVNYDIPTSVASYVHRVGRTARAGCKGRAWTFYTKGEAGWFWTAVAGKGESKSKGSASGHIKRKGKVEEVRIDDRWEEGRLEEFEGTLETLGKEASAGRRRR